MADDKKAAVEKLMKCVKKYDTMKQSLRKVKPRKAAKSIPFRDYLSDEKFTESLLPRQAESFKTISPSDRAQLLQINVLHVMKEAMDTFQEVEKAGSIKAEEMDNLNDETNDAIIEFFADKKKVDDLTLASVSAAYDIADYVNGL